MISSKFNLTFRFSRILGLLLKSRLFEIRGNEGGGSNDKSKHRSVPNFSVVIYKMHSCKIAIRTAAARALSVSECNIKHKHFLIQNKYRNVLGVKMTLFQ